MRKNLYTWIYSNETSRRKASIYVKIDSRKFGEYTRTYIKCTKRNYLISSEWNFYLRFIFSFPFSSVFVKIWISINVHDPLIIYANETERFVDFNASVILDKWPFGRIQCKWRRRVCQSGRKVLTLSFVLFSRVKTRIWRVVEHRLRNCRLTPGQVDA